MTSSFGDFDNLFGSNGPLGGSNPRIPRSPKKKVEKGVPWQAKIIDDKYYVPLEQVAELLEQNDVLPAVRKGLIVRCETLKMQRDLDNGNFGKGDGSGS